MLGLIGSKLGIGLIALLVVSGLGFYVKTLIEKTALMGKELEDREFALEGMAKAYSEYALNSEAVIEAYNINNSVLQSEYQKSRDIVSESVRRSNKHDYQKILNSSTHAFIKRANSATSRLFRDIEQNSTYPKNGADKDDTQTSLP